MNAESRAVSLPGFFLTEGLSMTPTPATKKAPDKSGAFH
ncbi:hypothetical protein X907_2110 [Glycocaulis alkaliphilus]|uniref:Uncharacterized protein n=1 Tax=Glycocaulis alkaliphilus TaxID=1434191 RepID=A0A3T0EB16_9PROT|nr:hypothetical protein X907_2110 [Glycocaulis alkaliphilus]